MDAPRSSIVTRSAGTGPPRPARPPAPHERWRARLHARLHGRPLPLVWSADALVSGASLWAGARLWTAWLRAAGVGAGDRIVCALPPGPAFVMLLVAALWDGRTFVPVPPGTDAVALGIDLDARLVVAPRAGADAWVVAPAAAGTPPADAATPRAARTEPTPDVRVLLRTSGTAGVPRWVALSDANLLAVVDSHAPHLALEGARVLSVLPWHHAFGLVLELLPALLAGAELLREPSAGRDVRSIVAVADEHDATHLSMVPATAARLSAEPQGARLLARLAGGVVGGAPVDAGLAGVLRTTRLRVGYGQTEASPGIALGAPGAWHPGALGTPLGCDVRVDADGVLAFRGPNAALGEWHPGADAPLVRLALDRWVRTGDLATREADGTLTFGGRLSDSFKLENGRFVHAHAIERRVRERWPAVEHALLWSRDGRALTLTVTVRDDRARDARRAGRDGGMPNHPAIEPFDEPTASVPSPAEVAALDPALTGRTIQVVRVSHAAWQWTAKGEIDRRRPPHDATVTRAGDDR